MFPENSYNVGPFTDVASTWGQQLWVFLNEPITIHSMTDASDNKRPAAEAIASELYQRFGENITQDRVKQFIGFLIRQVMERNGYKHISYGRQTRDNPVFKQASVYSHRDDRGYPPAQADTGSAKQTDSRLWAKQRNMQNIIEYLKDFNSKERFFLVGQILGNPDFTLASEFRDKLSDLLKIPIPADALSAMDYHLDWLYASLNLAKDKDLTKVYPNVNKLIRAQQEDIDWLIAFKGQSEYHLVLIEAKGVTSWTNKQMASKAIRFGDIFGEQGNNWPSIVPHFVIMSRSQSKGLLAEKWPQWMAPNGKILWLELPIPEYLLHVYRCNEQGRKSQNGQSWKVGKR